MTCTPSLPALPAPLLQQVSTSSLGHEPGIIFVLIQRSVLSPTTYPTPLNKSQEREWVWKQKPKSKQTKKLPHYLAQKPSHRMPCTKLATATCSWAVLPKWPASSLSLPRDVYVLGPLLSSSLFLLWFTVLEASDGVVAKAKQEMPFDDFLVDSCLHCPECFLPTADTFSQAQSMTDHLHWA